MKKLIGQLKALSKPHSFEIISKLVEGPEYISTISEELGIPYATTWHRLAELERVELVQLESSVEKDSKRAIKLARLTNFRLELSPRTIYEMIRGGEPEFKVV